MGFFLFSMTDLKKNCDIKAEDSLKKKYYAHFQVHNFIFGHYDNRLLTCFLLYCSKNTSVSSYCPSHFPSSLNKHITTANCSTGLEWFSSTRAWASILNSNRASVLNKLPKLSARHKSCGCVTLTECDVTKLLNQRRDYWRDVPGAVFSVGERSFCWCRNGPS